jgi:hypothetical protein
MPNNPEMSKFLYAIVKQLDLKSVGTPSLLLVMLFYHYIVILGRVHASSVSRHPHIAKT